MKVVAGNWFLQLNTTAYLNASCAVIDFTVVVIIDVWCFIGVIHLLYDLIIIQVIAVIFVHITIGALSEHFACFWITRISVGDVIFHVIKFVSVIFVVFVVVSVVDIVNNVVIIFIFNVFKVTVVF